MTLASPQTYRFVSRLNVGLIVVGLSWAAFNALAYMAAGISKTLDAVPGEVRDFIVGAVLFLIGLIGRRVVRRPPPPA